ncbi:MAG: class I SAM-dependent methyltransferase [Roseiflexaceae bacterium]
MLLDAQPPQAAGDNRPPMNPEIYALLDTVLETYWRYIARHELFARWWSRYRQPSTTYRVLDVGCGTGNLLAYLAKRVPMAPAGIDLFPDTLPYCVQRGIGAVSAADATALPFHDNMFDFVIAQDVVEHVEDDRLALQEMQRVCAPGGMTLVLVPAFTFLWSARDVKLRHYRRYTLDQIARRLQEAGFDLVHRTYTDLFLLPLLRAAIALAPRTPDGLADLEAEGTPGKSWLLNQALLTISRLESVCAYHAYLPFGVSAVVLGRKAAERRVF